MAPEEIYVTELPAVYYNWGVREVSLQGEYWSQFDTLVCLPEGINVIRKTADDPVVVYNLPRDQKIWVR